MCMISHSVVCIDSLQGPSGQKGERGKKGGVGVEVSLSASIPHVRVCSWLTRAFACSVRPFREGSETQVRQDPGD